MGPAPDVEGAAKASPLYARYGERLDDRSAREVLEERLVTPAPLPPRSRGPRPRWSTCRCPRQAAAQAAPRRRARSDVGDFLRSREGKRLQRKVLRGVFGMLRKRL